MITRFLTDAEIREIQAKVLSLKPKRIKDVIIKVDEQFIRPKTQKSFKLELQSILVENGVKVYRNIFNEIVIDFDA